MAYGRLSNRTRIVVKYFDLYRDIQQGDPTDLTPGEEEEHEVTWKMQQKVSCIALGHSGTDKTNLGTP